MAHPGKRVLAVIGVILIAIYFLALSVGDLRENTIVFVGVFLAAFLLYAAACVLVLNIELDTRAMYGVFAFAVVMQAVLIQSRPTLSDDMYRYIWDGRVQAHGISPYIYPPNAAELVFLRDKEIYPSINRKSAVSVYPPGAELLFLILWRLRPDNIQWLQLTMAAGSLLAGYLLVGLLRDLKRSTGRVILFLWSPLLAFETAHAAHIDGIILPLLVGACWARVRKRDGWVGLLLGLATVMKFYPALLFPFLWRPKHPKGRWSMPLTFGAAIGLTYLPYLFNSGSKVLGYLPNYFQETFNLSPLNIALTRLLFALRLDVPGGLNMIALLILGAISIWSVMHPAPDGEAAIRRCIWPVGVITLLSPNLFSWYLLWLLPLIALFFELSDRKIGNLRLPRIDAWTGWWLFCGLVGLSYTFFIRWKPVTPAILAEFLPLYFFLIFSLFSYPWKKIF